ncbi:MAG: hypothetical protein E3J54_03670 [Actinobacteria bacterium]|nr:MAG: hypothetical protein E3J54_03670 [Actinomycetota bacterium]
MQFLAIGKYDPSLSQLSQVELLPIMRKGIKQFEEDERTQSIYGLAGEPTIALITDVDTAGELDQFLSLNPLSISTDWEVHSLTNASELNETMTMLEEKVVSFLRSVEEAEEEAAEESEEAV